MQIGPYEIKPDANLRGADLQDAYLRDADLRGADLRGADLRGAYLQGANLRGADLRDAYLRRAYLQGADLQGANLQDANLRGAYLHGADLRGADLEGADAQDAFGFALVFAQTRIIPPEGSILGWKKCRDGILVKLKVPAMARRSHAFGRKCRAEHVEVLEVIGAEIGVSQHDSSTIYTKGTTVHCDTWNPDWRVECGGGIHFFITREEAEAY